ncbi:MAG: carboxylating nicotinate-nucleotide diphosphorylase [Planctomycetota bacterium]|nr:carboxylating nicotinate-nucleotide diphosphorylase [Planctomycetota bacterium]
MDRNVWCQSLVDRLLDLALDEDIGPGDATTAALFPGAGREAKGFFTARDPGVLAGGEVVSRLYSRLSARYYDDSGAVRVKALLADGTAFTAGTRLLEISGDARVILTGERTALNLLQRLCAVASRTRTYVDRVRGTRAVILDTRKTLPGHRILDKLAVVAGGGSNHRLGLYDMILIKDNHLAAFGGAAAAIRAARQASTLPVMVEVDNLEQLADALTAQPDYVLLDNMTPERLAEAVALTDARVREKGGKRPALEASGGVNLDTVAQVAKSGVDRISVGALTHAAGSLDIGLDFS